MDSLDHIREMDPELIETVVTAVGVPIAQVESITVLHFWNLLYTTSHELRGDPTVVAARHKLARLVVETTERAEIDNSIRDDPDYRATVGPDAHKLAHSAQRSADRVANVDKRKPCFDEQG